MRSKTAYIWRKWNPRFCLLSIFPNYRCQVEMSALGRNGTRTPNTAMVSHEWLMVSTHDVHPPCLRSLWMGCGALRICVPSSHDDGHPVDLSAASQLQWLSCGLVVYKCQVALQTDANYLTAWMFVICIIITKLI